MTQKPTSDSEVYSRTNETIGIKPTSGTLSLIVRRLFNVLLYISQKDGDIETYRRPLIEIMAHIEYNSNDAKLLKDHFRSMMNGILVEWNSVDAKGTQTWEASPLLAHARIESSENRPTIVEWSLPKPIRERLRDLTSYTRFSLQMHTRLRTGASVALYEICARYATNPSQLSVRAPVSWWHPRLTGSSSESEIVYKYFKRDVIRPSVAEINVQADFTVELIEYKAGNRVDEIQFRVIPKERHDDDDGESLRYDGALLEKVTRLGLSVEEAKRVCEKHDGLVVLDAIALTERRAAITTAEPLHSKAAYFTATLSKGYTANKKAPPKSQQRVLDLPLVDVEMGRLREAFNAKQLNEAFGYFKELDVTQQRAEIESFLSTKPERDISAAIKKNSLTNMVARTAFSGWLAAKLRGDPSSDELLEFALQKKAGP